MFNFFKKKPQAIINVSRRTGEEESCQVSVNSTELTKEEIFRVMNEAGEALRMRLQVNNQIILDMNAQIKAEEDAKKSILRIDKKGK